MHGETFTPEEATTEWARLTAVKERLESSFFLASTGAKSPEEAKAALAEVRRYNQELKEGLRRIREKVNPFESTLHLREQYDNQLRHLATAGILETLQNGQIGIRSIEVDGQVREYPIPTLEEVGRRLQEKREMVEQKQAQGFTQMLLVPFGMPLGTLIEKYKSRLLDHHNQGKLFFEKQNPSDPNEQAELYANEPVWVWNEHNNADKNGKLVYEPTSFDQQNHGGKAKTDILKHDPQGQEGWRILLEDLPVIPREGQGGQPIGERARLEANKTPGEYLNTFKTNTIYAHENGMTPEEWLTYAIMKLETDNQVAEDYQGKGSIAYLTGAYFPASDGVPYAYWNRDYQRSDLSGDYPDNRDERIGVRARVRV